MAETEALTAAKRALRSEMRSTLTAMDRERRSAESWAISEHVVAWRGFAEAERVLLYLPIEKGVRESVAEVDVRGIARVAVARGAAIAYPRLDWERSAMTARVVEEAMPEVECRRYGVPEPRDGVDVEDGWADLIVVPGLAFDREGGRLGRGGGFYDRFLERQGGARVLGVAFGAQVIGRVPVGGHDRKMDAIATPEGVFEVSGVGGGGAGGGVG